MENVDNLINYITSNKIEEINFEIKKFIGESLIYGSIAVNNDSFIIEVENKLYEIIDIEEFIKTLGLNEYGYEDNRDKRTGKIKKNIGKE